MDARARIAKCYYKLVFAFVMSLMLSVLMSGVIMLINLGWVPDFFCRWLAPAFPRAWVIAFPIPLFVVPAVQRIVRRLVAD